MRLNVGLVGYKFMGKAHSNAYARLGMFFDPGAEICQRAICGRDEKWVAESAKKFGWETYETSWERLVERDDIDIIDITAPSNVHKEIAVAAAKNGKHIFCEKPLALTTDDARVMLEAAEKAGVKHQIGFNYRFAPAVVLAKKLIDEGKLGTIRHVRASYLQDFIIDPDFPLVWRLQRDICGSGALGDLGAHFIDLARYLCGDFKTVMGIQKTFITSRPLVQKMEGLSAQADANAPRGTVDVDDGTVFIAEFENGALGVFEATRFAQGHKNDLSIEVNGDKGSIKFVFERMNELQYFSADDEPGTQGFRLIQATEGIHPYMTAWWPAGHVIGYEHTFVHEIYEFVRAIVNDTPTVPSFYDGVKCCQIIEAVELSAQRRAAVDVNEI
ncbi:MAG TPA: Gfo/Idh/MocA family oxidoreductase [Bacillota bacterium]|nr:Gfo/Idh/MocA family oxidoreductase [Clostridiales bacterium]HPT85090.1 Gfo/Idh/MocA family oxidoreductase [Bacillota bacterium]